MQEIPCVRALKMTILASAVGFVAVGVSAGEAKPPDDSVVYWNGDGKRVHVEGCGRLTTNPEELAKMEKMTLAEAETKGLPLCSRCPGSTTSGTANPSKGPESRVNPPPTESPGEWKPERKEFVADERAPLVSMGDDGRLVYKPYTDRGDRILDWSVCGYKRSEEPIPNVRVAETLTPPAGEAKADGNMAYPKGPDSSETIQATLDSVAAMAPDRDGFRGAVLLKKGTWYLSRTLRIQSGVVLRGEGDGPDGTVLIFTIPEGDADGVAVGAGASSEEMKPVTGLLTRGKGGTGDGAYFLTLEDGYRFSVSDPTFKPEVKLEGYVGSKVVLTMKAIVTTRGNTSSSVLKHNMPYEVRKLEAGEAPPPLDPNLRLPEQPLGAGGGPESRIADAYVPSGATQLALEDATGFEPGDDVTVVKTTNAEWIEVLGVGERLKHIRGGSEGAKKKPWGPQDYSHRRQITAVDGNTVTLDLMLPQSIAAEHGGGYVRKQDPANEPSHCGVESLRVVSNYDTTVSDESKSSNFRNLGNGITVSCTNGWVRNCTIMHVWQAAVNVADSRFCTVRDVNALEPVGPKRGGRRYPYSIGGSSCILVYRCFTEDGRHDFAVGARTLGPNAFVKCSALRGGVSEPHHRWGVGTLYDSIVLKEGGGIAAMNRGDSGSGHGWAAANTVVWNASAESVMVYDPETEGENNFAIGYSGPRDREFDGTQLWYGNTRAGYWGTSREGTFYGHALMGNGHIESPDKPVTPDSLFVQQLIDRIGRERAANVLN